MTAADSEFISNHLLEANAPRPASELAKALIRNRVAQENAAIRRELERSSLYQPKKEFNIGDELMFPALKFTSGVVAGKRAGNNPELGAFEVIRVKMSDGLEREFAANYAREHALNDDSAIMAFNAARDGQGQSSPDELAELHNAVVADKISAALEQNQDYMMIGKDWFLRGLMTDVNVGHLNLAEAVLDMAQGGPLPTPVILRDLGLPPEVTRNVQEISLNQALAADDRFDEISLDERPAWFLRRYEPQDVFELPRQLKPSRYAENVTLNSDLETLIGQLDDELDFDPETVVEPADKGAATLLFAHKRAGTLGWGRSLTAVLPQVNKPRVPVTFRDKVTGKQFLVWLVKNGRYIWGLADWYRQNDIPAGATIEISKGPAAHIFLVDFKRHRPRREWVRVASQRDAKLRLETAQRGATCEVDDLMSVYVDDPASLDPVRGDSPRDVAYAVREAFPEIAKLSPQGNVHARTLYAVVNTITRAAPRDVFAALTAAGNFVKIGDNYWHLGE
jgi:hypothetical protein